LKSSYLFLAAMFFAASCSTQNTKNDAAAAKVVSRQDYTVNVSLSSGVQESKGDSLSDFWWYDSSGKKVSLADLKGKTVLINFWATWCGPCKAELPDIENLSRVYASNGFVVIGVSEDRGDNLVSDVYKFASQNGLTYQIVIDNDNVADAFGNVNALPTSFLIDKDGKIVEKWIGIRNKTFLDATVKRYVD